MSRENVEVVRAVFEQFAQGDFSSLANVADDFEWVTSSEVPDPGTYRGEAGQRWITEFAESTEGHTIEATEIIDAGDKVFSAIVQRGRPRGSRSVVEGHWWVVLTLREGVVVRGEGFGERAQALEAAGLSE